MDGNIDYDRIKANFADLVSRGIVSYETAEVVRLEDAGFKLEYHITQAITKKFQAEQAFQLPADGTVRSSSDSPRCFGPGSDIADADPKLLVATLNDSHILIIGKFCVIGPHLLLLTKDSYRRQRKSLDADDLAAAYSVITTLNPQHFAFYNCGLAAGASRQHKHIQILPHPGPMFPDKPDFDRIKIPFRFFLRYLGDVDQKPGQLTDIYSELLAQARVVLNIPSDEDCPHNMVLVREWILVIPRRSNDFNGVTANSAGMMGYVWLGKSEELDRWKRVGPVLALAGLGVPSGTVVDI